MKELDILYTDLQTAIKRFTKYCVKEFQYFEKQMDYVNNVYKKGNDMEKSEWNILLLDDSTHEWETELTTHGMKVKYKLHPEQNSAEDIAKKEALKTFPKPHNPCAADYYGKNRFLYEKAFLAGRKSNPENQNEK